MCGVMGLKEREDFSKGENGEIEAKMGENRDVSCDDGGVSKN